MRAKPRLCSVMASQSGAVVSTPDVNGPMLRDIKLRGALCVKVGIIARCSSPARKEAAAWGVLALLLLIVLCFVCVCVCG